MRKSKPGHEWQSWPVSGRHCTWPRIWLGSFRAPCCASPRGGFKPSLWVAYCSGLSLSLSLFVNALAFPFPIYLLLFLIIWIIFFLYTSFIRSGWVWTQRLYIQHLLTSRQCPRFVSWLFQHLRPSLESLALTPRSLSLTLTLTR